MFVLFSFLTREGGVEGVLAVGVVAVDGGAHVAADAVHRCGEGDKKY